MKTNKKRKSKPVALVVIESQNHIAGQKILNESIHDILSAKKFAIDNELDGKFEVVKILGTMSVSANTKRKVVFDAPQMLNSERHSDPISSSIIADD